MELFKKIFNALTQKKFEKSVTNIAYKEPTSEQFYRWHNSQIVKLHYNYLNKEQELYKKICQMGDCKGSEALELIRVCNDDIAIAADFRKLCIQCGQPMPLYPAFKYLAMLFEKREEYRAAISVCEVAIAKGYDDDGTKGGMQGRVARLKKKMGCNIEEI